MKIRLQSGSAARSLKRRGRNLAKIEENTGNSIDTTRREGPAGMIKKKARSYLRRELASFSAGDASSSIAFGRDGTTIVCAGERGTMRVFDVASARERLQFQSSHKAPAWAGPIPQEYLIGAAGLSTDGSRFASCGGFDSQVKVWDAQKGELTRVFGTSFGNRPSSVAFSQDGRLLAVSAATGPGGPSIVSLWDIQKNQAMRTFTVVSSLDRLAFNPNGTRLAAVGRD
jgi:WD40 repeat protein